MKYQRALVFILLICGLNAKDFDLSEFENPNGHPFLVSFGIEKNIDSFKYYNQSNYFVTVPISNMLTFKYRENVRYSEDMVVFRSEHNKIEFFDRYYTLEFHLPVYKLFGMIK